MPGRFLVLFATAFPPLLGSSQVTLTSILLIGIRGHFRTRRYHCLLHETWDHPPNRATTAPLVSPAYFYRRR
jgi:hypothetical protein